MASNTNPIVIPLAGGLNVAVSDQMMPPGECTELLNYEITTTGRYQRMQGYERFDGQDSPAEVAVIDLPGFPFDTIEETIAAVRAAQEARRALITAVPGSGPVLGVFMFAGIKYAFRNTVDGTGAKLYRATAIGWVEVVTPALSPGGRYQVIETNFSGAADEQEIIGVDGRNPAFRFDGTTFTQITGPITPDQPTYCEALASNKLLLSYRGGSLVYSQVGDPAGWDGALGAGEIAVGQEIVGIEAQADDATAIHCRNRTYMLYGRSEVDFQLKEISRNSGAIPWSIQNMGQSLYLDDRGLTRLDRVQSFGNFESSTLSQKIQPILTSRLQSVAASCLVRTKNQYRLFFTDSTGITMTMYGGEVMGFSEFRLGFVPSCLFSGEDTAGRELVFAGGVDGFVYQLDKGNNQDGAAYTSRFQTSFMSMGRPEDKKRWRKLVIECDSVTRVFGQFRCFYDYADPNIPMADIIVGSGSKWDLSDWDDATWDGSSTSWTDQYIDGVSRNIAIQMASESDYYPPHIVSQLFLHASPRGRRR
ncbi:hypothetical protein [Arsukibacterium indicum]|uniref:Phage tail protein n=1 Tax=Arsukibacterium indicum TaxID=2848612 RepID=A0ABS6MHR1_9GAMM|nr:hypothetical protein [Arsukibacterium indicum]MBV2128160.1 hypothetical protein [Arsukibacterium indicum]